MKYLVMECALSYAVLLDSDGRFLKVPNLGYEVGQVLNETVIGQKHPSRTRARRLMAMAACLCLVLFGGWQFWRMPVGAVRLQINPEVQIEVIGMEKSCCAVTADMGRVRRQSLFSWRIALFRKDI